MAAFLALLSAITYGTGDFFGGLATRRVGGSWPVVLVSQAVGLAMAAAIVPLVSGSGPTLHDLAWGAAGGTAGGAALLCFYQALGSGTMSIVAPTTAACSAVVPLAVGLARGERPASLAVAGVGLALGAIVLFGLQPHDTSGATHRLASRGTSLTLSLAAGVGFGLFFVCIHEASGDTGLWPILGARVMSLTVVGTAAVATGQALRVGRVHLAVTAAAGVADVSANALFLVASRRGLLSLVSVIGALYPASTIVLAVALLHERLTRIHAIALAVAGAAVVLIALA